MFVEKMNNILSENINLILLHVLNKFTQKKHKSLILNTNPGILKIYAIA